MTGEEPECLYQLRGRVDHMTWHVFGHPYCEERAAIAAAQLFTEHYACVQVINSVTGGVVYEAKRRMA